MDRRHFLRGLIAAPAIVPISSLMPLRGVLLRPAGVLAWLDPTYDERIMWQSGIFWRDGGNWVAINGAIYRAG